MAAKTPKKKKSEKGSNWDPGMFDHVMNVEDFAAELGVNENTIPLITPLTELCKSKECPFNAIVANRGFCPVHCKWWYPKEGDRGTRMHGPEFLYSRNQNRRGCSCSYKPCMDAGYFPSHDALYIPLAMRKELLSTGRLFSAEKLKEYAENPKKNMSLYPWHFLREHLTFDNGNWKLDYDERAPKIYRDMENKRHNYPPPIGNVERFIEEELSIYTRPQDRWMTENSESMMPTWMLDMLAIDEEHSLRKEPSPRKLKIAKEASCPRSQAMKSEMQRARINCLSNRVVQMQISNDRELSEAKTKYNKDMTKALEDHKKAMAATVSIHEKVMAATVSSHKQAMATTKKSHEEAMKKKVAELDAARATISEQKDEIVKLNKLFDELDEEYRQQAELLKQRWESSEGPLTYDDLLPGGRLGHNVKDFTFFRTKEQNDLFLEVVNFADGTEGAYDEGDGLCENMRPYNNIKPEERDGLIEPPCMDMNSPEYATRIQNSKRARSHLSQIGSDSGLCCMLVRYITNNHE